MSGAGDAPRPRQRLRPLLTLRQVQAMTAMWIKVAVQYRIELGIWAIAGIVQAVVYLAVWRAVAEARGGSIGGYSAAEFAGYFLALLLVRELTYTWMPYHFPEMVREGRLSPKLLLPVHPLLGLLADEFCFRLQGTIFLVPIGLVLALLYDTTVHPTWQGLLAGALTIPLASAARFLADSCLAITAFWLTRIEGVRGIYYMVLLLLGGQFVPIDVLPEGAQLVAKLLPFYWALGYPVELLVGRADPGQALGGAAVLVAWIAGLQLLLTTGWRRGTARYGAVGA